MNLDQLSTENIKVLLIPPSNMNTTNNPFGEMEGTCQHLFNLRLQGQCLKLLEIWFWDINVRALISMMCRVPTSPVRRRERMAIRRSEFKSQNTGFWQLTLHKKLSQSSVVWRLRDMGILWHHAEACRFRPRLLEFKSWFQNSLIVCLCAP